MTSMGADTSPSRDQKAVAAALAAQQQFEASGVLEPDGTRSVTWHSTSKNSHHFPVSFFASQRPPTVLGAQQVVHDIGRPDAALRPLYLRMSAMLRFRIPGLLLALMWAPPMIALSLAGAALLLATGAALLGAGFAWSDLGILWACFAVTWYVAVGFINLMLMLWRAARPFDWVCFLLESANYEPLDFMQRLARSYARSAVTTGASLQRAEAILMRRTLRSRRYGTSTARGVDVTRRRDAARALGYAEILLADDRADIESLTTARYLIDRVRIQTRLRDWSCRADLPEELYNASNIHMSRRRAVWHNFLTVALPIAAGIAGVYAAVRSDTFGGDFGWLSDLFDRQP